MKATYTSNEDDTPYDDSQMAMRELEQAIASNMSVIFNALLATKKRMETTAWEKDVDDMIECHKESRSTITDKFLDLLSDINTHVEEYDALEDAAGKEVDRKIDEDLGK